ncbi:MAG: response regulator [Deltaproteobacteria bacterium]|nr:response regulator [Deltaproteobacteria bacterium]
MTQSTVLLVEDNPITRKLVRFTLEKQNLRVLEAADASSALTLFPAHAITLVLQDLCLPDMNGFDLVGRLRELPGGREVPILVFSGMLSHEDEARVSAAGFDDLITKPVEPSRLVQIINSYLPQSPGQGVALVGEGRRMVVADDDPVQRRLVGFRMQKLGFEVFTAADGIEALEQARRLRPDVVLSDVLMPGLDGFGLCLELRRDPAISAIPVVLTTNSYVETTDRELAQRAGARDLVLRTPELREVLEAVRQSLTSPPRSFPDVAQHADVERDHAQRMMRQLERQVALNAGINQRCAVLAAEMTVLQGISEALASDSDIDAAIEHTLAACLDAGGISLGALFLRENTGLRVLSFGFAHDWTEAELLDFFGEREVLDNAMESRQSKILFAAGADGASARALAKARAASAIIIPLTHKGLTFGALVMLSRNGELQRDDRVKFGEAVAGQISQALAVAYAFREKDRSERAAREQTAILRSVIESIGDGVGVVDEKRKLILWNSAASELAKHGTCIAVPMGADGGAGFYDADGITPTRLDRLPLVRAMHGEVFDGVEVFLRHAGAPNGVWLSATGRPWRGENGIARGGVAVFRDVTSEKATQAQLLVSDRMASVGMLAAGVAHEINNPLASVLLNLDLCVGELDHLEASGAIGNVDELRETLNNARESAGRVRQIVRDLKVFSRHEDTRSEAVDVRTVLESSLRMAWNEIRHRAQLIKDLADVPLVEGSESRLGQVFLNLIMNAAQAIEEGNVDGNEIRISTALDSTGRILVTISDTGRGIAHDELKNLFRPFYTTKGPGVGTGLGLAISHRIVTGLGGEIQVESEYGKGTTFKTLLPPARSRDPTDEVSAATTAPATRRARILVIDDEARIAKAIRRTLESEHDVIACVSAAQAMEHIRSDGPFDVILCDLMMPQTTGMELHAELRTLNPAVAERMIFLTGGAFTPAARAFLDRVPNQRVEKPFDAQHLRALINDRVR